MSTTHHRWDTVWRRMMTIVLDQLLMPSIESHDGETQILGSTIYGQLCLGPISYVNDVYSPLPTCMWAMSLNHYPVVCGRCMLPKTKLYVDGVYRTLLTRISTMSVYSPLHPCAMTITHYMLACGRCLLPTI